MFMCSVCLNQSFSVVYSGESMKPEGMLALMKWEEETPFVYFFKHGLIAEKVVSLLVIFK